MTENDRIWILHNRHVYHSIKVQNSTCASGVETDFGQSDFGHRYPTDFGQSDFGQSDFGQSDFGQTDFGQTDFGQFLCFSVSPIGAPKGGAPKGGAPKGGVSKGGARRVGGPKFRAFFFPVPPQNSFFSSLSGGLLVEFGWCLKRRGAQMCTFGVLRLSCAGPGGPVWWGRRGFTRQSESPNVHI